MNSALHWIDYIIVVISILAAIGMGGAVLYLYAIVGLGQISSFILYSRKFSGPINEIANIINALLKQVFRCCDNRICCSVKRQKQNL